MTRPPRVRRSRLTLLSPAVPVRSPAPTRPPNALHPSRDEQRDDPVFDEGFATLAGIVPVPPHITPAMRGVLERSLLMRFEFAEEVDTWITSSNARLDGAAPYERLLDGDGMAVLRALLAVPINPRCTVADVEDGHDEMTQDDDAPMRLVG